MRRQLNGMKREHYPWMFDVTKCAVQEAIIDLGTAFRALFEKRGERDIYHWFTILAPRGGRTRGTLAAARPWRVWLNDMPRGYAAHIHLGFWRARGFP